jgi:hypothetical protein
MKKDVMKKDVMKKDVMKKDVMKKDVMKKDVYRPQELKHTLQGIIHDHEQLLDITLDKCIIVI